MTGCEEQGSRGDLQDGFQALLVHRHLDGDMREVVIDDLARPGLDGGVVLRVLVVLRDRAYAHSDVLDNLEREELYAWKNRGISTLS